MMIRKELKIENIFLENDFLQYLSTVYLQNILKPQSEIEDKIT